MQYDILLTKEPSNGYVARPVLLPEIVVSGADEEALARVRDAIANTYANSRIVRVTVPLADETVGDPWLRFAGMWADDPEWEQFLADVETFRRTIDEQTQGNSES